MRACAGPIDLIDRKGKHLECFSYGGELRIELKETSTRLILNSPAPILIRPAHALVNMLAEESEILLAERRAATPDPEIFEKHLASADPLALYRACLEALYEQLHHLPTEENELMFKYKHMLSSEREAIEQVSTESLNPCLEKIL